MAEIEPPTEHLHEHIQEGVEHNHSPWMVWVALSTAFLAVLAAIASLMANHHSDEALLSQIKSSNKWSYYEAKSIKSEILKNTNTLLEAYGKPADISKEQKVVQNLKEQEEIFKEATNLDQEAQSHIKVHAILAKSVTIFQIAIAISAITILTKRKFLWYISLAFTAWAVYFLLIGAFL